jgi:hypothetical protein
MTCSRESKRLCRPGWERLAFAGRAICARRGALARIDQSGKVMRARGRSSGMTLLPNLFCAEFFRCGAAFVCKCLCDMVMLRLRFHYVSKPAIFEGKG